jgi:hypothetical protein
MGTSNVASALKPASATSLRYSASRRGENRPRKAAGCVCRRRLRNVWARWRAGQGVQPHGTALGALGPRGRCYCNPLRCIARAGLELIEAVGGLNSSAPLQTRVGIATGLVVVGDLIGSGAAQEQAVVGLDDSPTVKLDKLQAVLAQTSTSLEDQAHLHNPMAGVREIRRMARGSGLAIK